jgi:hypothetical protein
LEWRGRLLSLPVREPSVPYLGRDELPGFARFDELLQAQVSRSLAESCVRSPREEPLSELFSRS